MNKKIEDIEQILKNNRLPDQESGHIKSHIWKEIIKAHRERFLNSSPLFRFKPWLWSLASILLLAVCLLLMWLISRN